MVNYERLPGATCSGAPITKNERQRLLNPSVEYSQKFEKHLSENNLKEAYHVFEDCREVLLFYYKHNGEEKTNELIDATKKEVGLLRALNMRLTLPTLIKKDKKHWDNFVKRAKKLRENREKSEIESRKGIAKVMKMHFDF